MRVMMAAAALMLCLIPGLASAAWLEASSDHFVIYANDSERDITRFAQQLERYHAGMASVLGVDIVAPSPSNRVTVYVVRNDRAVRQVYGGNNKYLGGFYVPHAGGSIAVVPAVQTGNGPVTLSMLVLLHEYAHHFMISSNAAAMPRWLSEGSAEFFASSGFDPDGSIWLGRPAQHRAGELYLAKDVKVADLLDPTQYDARPHTTYDAFYGKSWLLYHYLTFEPARKGQLRRYVQLLQAGESQRDAGLHAFGDFAVLEKDVERYLARPKMSALKLQPQLLHVGPVRVRAVSAGEAAVIPSRLRSKRGISTTEEAAEVLADTRKVAAQYPDDPAVLSQLAEAEYDGGHDKEAIAAADAALARDPKQANAYVQKGLALFREANAADADSKAAAFKAARRPFIALNAMENDHPIPLIYFYRSFAEQGIKPPSLAVDGLIRAVQLAPFDMGLRLMLGHVLIRQGRQDEARIALAPVAYNPHDSELAGRARQLLERMDKGQAGKRANLDDADSDEPAPAAPASAPAQTQ
ncbi:DUF1570 domain-containing protein [Novosphingobium sp. Leaf2]|uniref:DUF1570 domain-containing protein n=1 Tax=Novosphingobium sp. Leaf2 TaxID=1735670 RepID=UPI000B02340F|nr:DUF1570 domain-containing protein [Novosphingobium sp. Leaf2]